MPSMTTHIREGEMRDHELMDRVDSRRVIGDNRAPHLRNLIGMGLAATRALEDAGISVDTTSDSESFPNAREELIETAVRQYVESMDDPEQAVEVSP